jgi:polar amino acid transport system permease protein
MVWNWNYTIEVFPILLKTLWITISATLVAFIVAAILGLVFALARRSKIKVISYVSYWVIEFIRITPPLVQLFFIFYVLPHWGIQLTPFVAGVLGLGIHYSTYLSEVYRSGIDSVDQGQWEAATSLNFSPLQKWRIVILPQAIRPVIPMMGNYLITLFKETPLLSSITVIELLGRAKILGSESLRYLELITLVGLFFLIISYTASLLVKWIESRVKLPTQ